MTEPHITRGRAIVLHQNGSYYRIIRRTQLKPYHPFRSVMSDQREVEDVWVYVGDTIGQSELVNWEHVTKVIEVPGTTTTVESV